MTLHVVGAGLAGLSCALAAADGGLEVVLHEAAAQPGGRCRSWHEASLDAVIDNGSHLVVGGNSHVFDYLRRIGAEASLRPIDAALPMRDLASDQSWTASPWRLLPTIIASLGRVGLSGERSIAAALGRSSHYRTFWEPLAVSVLNTAADTASTRLFRQVLVRTLWRGAKASQPFMARQGLSESFVAPAMVALAAAGVTFRPQHRLRAIAVGPSRAEALCFDDGTISLAAEDQVVLALPWWSARSLLPELPELPASPIVNAHFRLAPATAAALPQEPLGLVGGTAHWLFRRGEILSATVSAADALAERSVEEIAARLWADAAKALQIKGNPLSLRIIKEKRATLCHRPEVEALRPSPRLRSNLLLAGDWTATGLPWCIEGALLSGRRAAGLSLSAPLIDQKN